MPPDTEIIKYTSSIVGPKIPGTTSRGRKKTISDEQNQLQQQKLDLDSTTNALSSLLAFPGLSPAKRARLEMEYAAIAAAANAAQQQHQQQQSAATGAGGVGSVSVGVGGASSSTGLPGNLTASQMAVLSSSLGANSTATPGSSTSGGSSQNTPHLDLTGPSSGRTSRDSSTDRVEVIKLPPTITSNGAYNLSNKNKDIHDLTGGTDLNSGVNLSLKPAASSISNSSHSSSANVAGTTITIDDFDAPLNLSMKPDKSSSSSNDLSGGNGNNSSGGSGGGGSGNSGASSLQSLSSITAALGGNGGGSGSGGVGGGANSSNLGGNSSSNSSTTSAANDRSSQQSSFKEGRPRNLGRGVSKPKKNTVASLLAQSRAVGIKPMLATQQLLQQGADIVRIFRNHILNIR